MNQAEQLSHLCKQFSLEILYAFGSRAQQARRFVEARQPLSLGSSDLDIGILPGRSLSVREKVVLANGLEDLFAAPRVDLVSLPDADPFLAANIIRGERLYERDAYRADEYDLYVLRRAGDLIPLERERQALILEKFI
jgi:hypothetical protein